MPARVTIGRSGDQNRDNGDDDQERRWPGESDLAHRSGRPGCREPSRTGDDRSATELDRIPPREVAFADAAGVNLPSHDPDEEIAVRGPEGCDAIALQRTLVRAGKKFDF